LKENMGWIYGRLRERYGAKRPSRERDLAGLLVRTILSQNTNDLNRDRAYQRLRKKFRNWEDLISAKASAIENQIRVGGLAHQKAGRIRQILRRIKNERGSLDLSFLCRMPAEKAREYLLSFNGVGDKTAAILILFGCRKNAFPVDTHIFRVSKKLGLIPEKAGIGQAHRILGETVPAELAYEFHLNLIEHGREICRARKPDCPNCPLKMRCQYYLKNG